MVLSIVAILFSSVVSLAGGLEGSNNFECLVTKSNHQSAPENRKIVLTYLNAPGDQDTSEIQMLMILTCTANNGSFLEEGRGSQMVKDRSANFKVQLSNNKGVPTTVVNYEDAKFSETIGNEIVEYSCTPTPSIPTGCN